MKLESHRADVIDFAKQIKEITNPSNNELVWGICTGSIIIATLLADIADELMMLRVLVEQSGADYEDFDVPDIWRN